MLIDKFIVWKSIDSTDKSYVGWIKQRCQQAILLFQQKYDVD